MGAMTHQRVGAQFHNPKIRTGIFCVKAETAWLNEIAPDRLSPSSPLILAQHAGELVAEAHVLKNQTPDVPGAFMFYDQIALNSIGDCSHEHI